MVRVEDMNLLSGIRDVGCFPGHFHDDEDIDLLLWGHLSGLGKIYKLYNFL